MLEEEINRSFNEEEESSDEQKMKFLDSIFSVHQEDEETHYKSNELASSKDKLTQFLTKNKKSKKTKRIKGNTINSHSIQNTTYVLFAFSCLICYLLCFLLRIHYFVIFILSIGVISYFLISNDRKTLRMKFESVMNGVSYFNKVNESAIKKNNPMIENSDEGFELYQSLLNI